MIRSIKIAIFFFSCTIIGFSQSSTDTKFFLNLNSGKKEQSKDTSEEVKADKNEIAVSVEVLYRFYKANLSSQDGSRCSFYPSCADYCNQAIHKHGLIKGGIHAMDRLTRCNGFSPHKYKIDMKRRKLVDNVK